ncbi:MAG: serine hydrolase domain-containing protein [Pseudomonadota bacterium]
MFAFRAFALATLTLLAAPAVAQDMTPAEIAKVDTIVGETLAKTGVPSASIAIVRGGKTVFAKAYGKQSETGTVARTDAPYQIASISKQFTAAALLLLEDEGKLSLDDTVSKWIPGITGGDRITIRQLLSHTSGLQDYWPQDYSFALMAKPTTPQGIVDRWAKKPLDFEPGTQWQYSNTGYVVAGLIVEKAAGKSLLAYLQDKIFKPLAIKAIDQDKAIGPAYPQGYGRFALGPVRPETPSAAGWLYAAGELSMSAADLAKWDIARIDRTVLTPEDWKLQESSIKLTDGKDTGYGLGVFAGMQDGRWRVEHSGEAVGFISENVVYPNDKAAFVVLTNSWSAGAASQIAGKLVATFLPAPGNTLTVADALAMINARKVFDQLRGGTLDRTMLTENANYYFTPTAIGDYRASLAPLGEPQSFAQSGRTNLRGGYELRSFAIKYADRTLRLSTFFDPANGKIEQFLVTPSGQ